MDRQMDKLKTIELLINLKRNNLVLRGACNDNYQNLRQKNNQQLNMHETALHRSI